MNETLTRLEEVFRNVLGDDRLKISAETCGKDLENWDSLTHARLMVRVEKLFGIRFTNSEITAWKNVGALAQLVEARLQQKA